MLPTPEHLWCGRRVKVCDGSSVTLSDTPANQHAYPQPSNQAPGCGFPMMKILVVFSLATGALLEVLTAPLNTMDVTLVRLLYAHLTPEDVILADRAFGTYVDLALIAQHKADGVFRKHHARKSDFRKGKKLGIGDPIVTWTRPKRCAAGMSLDEFRSIPEQLTVREVHVLVQQPGFRSREIIIVTTLLDTTLYTRAKLAQLYLLRWQVEVNLKHLKTTLGMEFLAVKTPEMAANRNTAKSRRGLYPSVNSTYSSTRSRASGKISGEHCWAFWRPSTNSVDNVGSNAAPSISTSFADRA
ncbi:MAG: IS4 family transposase [Merismopedia sp. SIO2A8]|nr:IS4 family transposase [Merismopedia sp. SIO2A8]